MLLLGRKIYIDMYIFQFITPCAPFSHWIIEIMQAHRPDRCTVCGSTPLVSCPGSRGFLIMAATDRANHIAEWLYRTCVLPDGGVRLRETGVIPPTSSLKHTKTREACEWAGKITHKQKYFTKAACRMAVVRLLELPRVQIPSVQGLFRELWEEQQSKLVAHLCRRARKNFGSHFRFPAYKQLCSMDWQETMPMHAEARYFMDSNFL